MAEVFRPACLDLLMNLKLTMTAHGKTGGRVTEFSKGRYEIGVSIQT